MADQVRADYEALAAVSQAFKQQADAMKKTEGSLKSKAQGIRSTWIGKGANEFQKEFEQSIVPTFEKLVGALNEAGKVTGDISKMFQDAEQEAKVIVTIRIE